MERKRQTGCEAKDVFQKTSNKGRHNKLYECVMNCAAPALTAVFIAGSLCWAAETQYSGGDDFDANPEVKAVFSSKASGLHVETGLPGADIGLGVTENTGAELVEACGVYVDNEFVGAVVSGEHIEDELKTLLDGYKNDESVISADYVVETELKPGVYRSAALVSAEEMADYLMGEKEVVTEYTAGEGDTPEKLADDFGMTVEEVRRLNPTLSRLEKGRAVKVLETVPVLPVKYTCEVTEEETLDIGVIMEGTGEYLSGEEAVLETGEAGRRIKQYEVTYIDGTEVSRKLKKSETVIEPVFDSSRHESDLYSESLPDIESSINFIWPVNGGYISDPFMSDRNHKGMDIAADSGTDIYAADGGVVTAAGWNDGGYGNFVVIDHENGYTTLYGHASEVYVSEGQRVTAGEVIAAVGTTGDSTGNHCHFEVIYGGSYLDPAVFICE